MKTKNKYLFTILFIIVCHHGFSQSSETGMASFYNDKFEGKTTASGEVFSQSKLTGAHRTLPFKTKIKVTNLANKKSVVVTVNDRGPFVKDRIIDLSKKAAIKLDFIDKGVAKVRLEVVGAK
jgi:rare lipoprotein A